MTVSVTNTLAGPYIPNGVTTTFRFDFKVSSVDEVRVFRVVDGAETDVDPGFFTVVIAADTEGGSVVFTLPPAPGLGDLYVEPDPLFTQPANFNNNGFLPRTINPQLDRAALRDLWLKNRVDRSLRLPISAGGVGELLPLPGSTGVVTLTPSGQVAVLPTGALVSSNFSDFDGGFDGLVDSGSNFDGGIDG